jgi:hypothetical protein
MKQLNMHIECTFLMLLYQIREPFFNGATLRRVSTNVLNRVELYLRRGRVTVAFNFVSGRTVVYVFIFCHGTCLEVTFDKTVHSLPS